MGNVMKIQCPASCSGSRVVRYDLGLAKWILPSDTWCDVSDPMWRDGLQNVSIRAPKTLAVVIPVLALDIALEPV